MDLLPRVRRQLSLEVVPGWHEVDEDVFVRANAEVVVEQARRNLERLTLRGRLRHGTTAIGTEKGLIGGRRVKERRSVRLYQFPTREESIILRVHANREQ